MVKIKGKTLNQSCKQKYFCARFYEIGQIHLIFVSEMLRFLKFGVISLFLLLIPLLFLFLEVVFIVIIFFG